LVVALIVARLIDSRDWLQRRQSQIEIALATRHLNEGTLALPRSASWRRFDSDDAGQAVAQGTGSDCLAGWD